MDQSKKTMRHFYCRDVLWETFEQMANDFDCSIDYLINESMRYYARSKNYQAPGAAAAPAAGTGPEAIPGRPPNLPESNRGGVAVVAPRRTIPPPPPAMGSDGAMPMAARRPASIPPGSVPAVARRATMPPPQPAPAAGPTLFLIFNSQRIPVDKDQFIIGRGSKTSDLAIKDGNISRKHAAIIRRNGTYYIKDLGSTNGIDYKGMRIDNKRIDEGDVFHLCDYELRFTYR
jgi:FHA domain